ncbi:uncharacterized protein [Triticum aestivum]|uniref:uncharacterized protein n=1 Tax=Triticum aestivum TaxID=4565 RepID=UPI001D01D6EC|nr:uncharacterized protein LOC123045255 [Triticum aestivum]
MAREKEKGGGRRRRWCHGMWPEKVVGGAAGEGGEGRGALHRRRWGGRWGGAGRELGSREVAGLEGSRELVEVVGRSERCGEFYSEGWSSQIRRRGCTNGHDGQIWWLRPRRWQRASGSRHDRSMAREKEEGGDQRRRWFLWDAVGGGGGRRR